MRLINAKTVQLEDFTMRAASDRPPYAILSHTWGAEEVLFEDMTRLDQIKQVKPGGYEKIQYTCQQALEDGLAYAWIDTCCIDKSSSAELSEAINSMYKWYQDSTVCYVYLPDVPGHRPKLSHDQTRQHGTGIAEFLDVSSMAPETQQLVHSRWFTRGWTLQELLAPRHLEFFGQGWDRIGTLGDETLEYILSYKTRIPMEVLRHELDLANVSIAKRMSWAATRQTTREEDQAYSLLGIFGVNLPLLYGEGSRAFRRLQAQIAKVSGDHSILAWKRPFATPDDKTDLIFAAHVSQFSDCTYISQRSLSLYHSTATRDRGSYTITKDGIDIDLRLIVDHGAYGLLDCYDERESTKLVALRLWPLEFKRLWSCERFGISGRVLLTVKRIPKMKPRKVGLTNRMEVAEDRVRLRFFDKRSLLSQEDRKRWSFKVREVYPAHAWNSAMLTCRASTIAGMSREQFKTVEGGFYEPTLSTQGLILDIVQNQSQDGTATEEDRTWPVVLLFSYATDSGATGFSPSSYGGVLIQDISDQTLEQHCQEPVNKGGPPRNKRISFFNLPNNGPGLCLEILSSDPYPIVALTLVRPIPTILRHIWRVAGLVLPLLSAFFWMFILFIPDYLYWRGTVQSEWDISDLPPLLKQGPSKEFQENAGTFQSKQQLRASGKNVIRSQFNRLIMEEAWIGLNNGRDQETIVKGLSAFAKPPKKEKEGKKKKKEEEELS